MSMTAFRIVFWGVLLYLLGAVIAWDPHMSQWPFGLRATMVSLFAVVALIVLAREGA